MSQVKPKQQLKSDAEIALILMRQHPQTEKGRKIKEAVLARIRIHQMIEEELAKP